MEENLEAHLEVSGSVIGCNIALVVVGTRRVIDEMFDTSGSLTICDRIRDPYLQQSGQIQVDYGLYPVYVCNS